MASSIPRSWIKHVESVVIQTKELPMWGSFPAFPWETLSLELSKVLTIDHFHLLPHRAEWVKGKEVLEGMGEAPFHIGIALTPLKGSFSFVMPCRDFSLLSSQILHPNHPSKTFEDPSLQQGFFHYLIFEAMNVIDQLNLLPGVTPTIVNIPIAQEDAYCVNFSIQCDEKTYWARLIFPTIFQSALKTHLSQKWQFSIPSRLYSSLFLPLSLCSGGVTISQEEWSQARVGDFILLDRNTYCPHEKSGKVRLMLNQHLLLKTTLDHNQLKILDYAFYYEDNMVEDDDKTAVDDYDGWNSEEEEEGEDFLSSTEEDQSIMGESLNEEESLHDEIRQKEPTSYRSPKSEKLTHASQVPLNLNLEIGRLNMSLETLLQLKPGNVIDLSTEPELVNLVFNGRAVARGHLVQIGEVVGVHITDIGA